MNSDQVVTRDASANRFEEIATLACTLRAAIGQRPVGTDAENLLDLMLPMVSKIGWLADTGASLAGDHPPRVVGDAADWMARPVL